jgi:hypothetical protein
MTKKVVSGNKSLIQSKYLIPLNIPKIERPNLWSTDKKTITVINLTKDGEQTTGLQHEDINLLDQEMHFNVGEYADSHEHGGQWKQNSFPWELRPEVIPEVVHRYLNWIPGGWYCIVLTTPPNSKMALHCHSRQHGDSWAINMTWGEGEHHTDFYSHPTWDFNFQESIAQRDKEKFKHREDIYAILTEKEQAECTRVFTHQNNGTCLINLSTIHGVRNHSNKPRTTIQFAPYIPLKLETALKNLKNRVK